MAGEDRFLGAWRVTEHVFDPRTRRHLGDVHQQRVLHRGPGGPVRITQTCESTASLAGHEMAAFAGEWVFDIEVEGATRRYRGPDVVGEGTEWSPGALTGAGRWPRFGYDFSSWSVLVAPNRQLTGGTFYRSEGTPVAVVVGVAVHDDPALARTGWPRLDLAAANGEYGPFSTRADGFEVRDEATGTTVRACVGSTSVTVEVVPDVQP